MDKVVANEHFHLANVAVDRLNRFELGGVRNRRPPDFNRLLENTLAIFDGLIYIRHNVALSLTGFILKFCQNSFFEVSISSPWIRHFFAAASEVAFPSLQRVYCILHELVGPVSSFVVFYTLIIFEFKTNLTGSFSFI